MRPAPDVDGYREPLYGVVNTGRPHHYAQLATVGILGGFRSGLLNREGMTENLDIHPPQQRPFKTLLTLPMAYGKEPDRITAENVHFPLPNGT